MGDRDKDLLLSQEQVRRGGRTLQQQLAEAEELAVSSPDEEERAAEFRRAERLRGILWQETNILELADSEIPGEPWGAVQDMPPSDVDWLRVNVDKVRPIIRRGKVIMVGSPVWLRDMPDGAEYWQTPFLLWGKKKVCPADWD